ncbi:hypothetical protein CROQUDRAFT_85911 [Cronartium quercuum f. sp. fusiforme G11]|uniref:Uncharacterized protein n=1 Tax=Cronartium quercuum f. sp. fusiforme G11 TaxID=708437 RepID=A0A9P6TGW6_9BASI|nr:hypothetical protein CROQUDRAFT_85911 [Cronartium quercuum f. sp. fusiforme G11]
MPKFASMAANPRWDGRLAATSLSVAGESPSKKVIMSFNTVSSPIHAVGRADRQKNVITNVTDDGMVVAFAPGSFCVGNTIVSKTRELLRGISMLSASSVLETTGLRYKSQNLPGGIFNWTGPGQCHLSHFAAT